MQQTLHHLQPILCQRFPARCINHGDGNIIHRQCGLLLQVGQRLPCPEQIRGGKIGQRPGTVFAPGIGHGGQPVWVLPHKSGPDGGAGVGGGRLAHLALQVGDQLHRVGGTDSLHRLLAVAQRQPCGGLQQRGRIKPHRRAAAHAIHPAGGRGRQVVQRR